MPAFTARALQMVQPLWYVRRNQESHGPFPAPQIEEALRAGEIVASDEVSLDGVQWQPVHASEFARPRGPSSASTKMPADSAWQAERLKARQRWEDGGQETGDGARVPVLDAVRMASLRVDAEETRAMFEAESRRKPSLIIAGMAVLVLAGAGLLVWFGQGDDAIRASIGKVSDCAASAAAGQSWAGCDKRAAKLVGVDLHNMSLAGTRFDNADLSGANLSYADLNGASLRSVNLSNANLLGATLEGADLSGAKLSGADLRYATLNRASVDGVRFDGAVLGKTTWTGGGLCDRLELCR